MKRECHFNPRAPRGARRHGGCRPGNTIAQFQSTRPARGATLCRLMMLPLSVYFNPRAPRGARRKIINRLFRHLPFQSTRPARGATLAEPRRLTLGIISIHAPREGRDKCLVNGTAYSIKFQSTRPARGATYNDGAIVAMWEFQSTRPARGATCGEEWITEVNDISIHAPREGRDSNALRRFTSPANFNPRAPRGARRLALCADFQRK